MLFKSTRGLAPKLNFEDVLLTGLANDGGLYMPETIPSFSKEEIKEMSSLTYNELCLKIFTKFSGNSIDQSILKDSIEETYNSENFSHQAITPLKQLSQNHYLLELFHGPTLAFKDMALQFFGNLLDKILTKRNERAIILGATSGDTGSAAIHGCRDCHNVHIFILHPYQKITEIQRLQMTTAYSDVIHNIALRCDFDKCQDFIKSLFRNNDFIKEGTHLIAVNSINWTRLMAQIVYYFYAAFSLGAPHKTLNFSVPTGNFGDILAGYFAKQMGLPINKLIIATNENDILTRFINHNSYTLEKLKHTITPSMDIQVSSNFERLLYMMHDSDGAKIKQLMEQFKKTGSLSVAPEILDKIKKDFISYSANEEIICQTMKETHQNTGEIIDPHTAIGVYASNEFLKENPDAEIVTLATAHPAKFPISLEKSNLKLDKMPKALEGIFSKEEKYDILNADIEKVSNYIIKHFNA
jgi:threonine synthase